MLKSVKRYSSLFKKFWLSIFILSEVTFSQHKLQKLFSFNTKNCSVAILIYLIQLFNLSNYNWNVCIALFMVHQLLVIWIEKWSAMVWLIHSRSKVILLNIINRKLNVINKAYAFNNVGFTFHFNNMILQTNFSNCGF